VQSDLWLYAQRHGLSAKSSGLTEAEVKIRSAWTDIEKNISVLLPLYEEKIHILVKPGDKVLYWASEPANEDMDKIQDWRRAYLGYKNAGVAIADSDGFATLAVRHPQPYQVPLHGKLDAHVHYRVCMHDGFIGAVKTVKLDGKEMFEDYAPVMDATVSNADITPGIFKKEMDRQNQQKVDRYGMPPIQLSEGFASEENASVPYTPFLYQKPEDLGPTIASYANSTAERAQKMMIQTGAPDESPEATSAAPFTRDAPGPSANYVEGFRV
jgi:hypothetical protein